MNKKGIAEHGVVTALVMILTAIGSTGTALFATSNPTSGAFIATASALTYYSQQDHVKRDFRERKAIEEFGYDEALVKSLSDSDLLDAIRDVCTGNCQTSGRSDAAFASAGMLPRLGG